MLDFLNFIKNNKVAGLIGLSRYDRGLALAHITREKDTPFLALCEEIPAMSDDARLASLTKKVEELELTGAKCCFVLSETDYNILLVEAPQVEPAELRSAVRWKIKDLMDTPIEEAVIDVFPVPEDAYRNRKNMVYVVAARRASIEKTISLVEDSGLKLKAIDVPEFSMKNLSNFYSNDDYGLAFLDLKSTGSTMNLSKAGDICLTRRIRSKVDNDVLKSSDWDDTKDRLVLEIQRSLDYYESQMGQTQIARLLLAPRQQDSEQLSRELDEAMAVQVEAMDLSGKLETDLDLTPQLQQSCLAAIGAALRVEEVAA